MTKIVDSDLFRQAGKSSVLTVSLKLLWLILWRHRKMQELGRTLAKIPWAMRVQYLWVVSTYGT